jgi:hypothetical protein
MDDDVNNMKAFNIISPEKIIKSKADVGNRAI